MKLSMTDKNFLSNLTIAQKTQIVYGNYRDDEKSGEVAILLGGPFPYMTERVHAAAKLYFDGRVKFIIPTGGVECDPNTKLTEAMYMAQMLRELGVPDEAVIIENEARTTRENMLYSTIWMCRKIKLSNVKRVIIVTSASHVRRSLVHGKMLLPKTAEISGYAAQSETDCRDNWFNFPQMAERVEKEIYWLKGLVTNEKVEDIEY